MKVSKKLILNEAVEIRDFVNKNKQLPKYATISNSQFSQSQYCYILAKLINKMSLPTISKITVKEPSNPTGDAFNNVKIVEKDYVDIAKRVTAYIETHKQAPNYASYNSKNIRFELYTYCFAKILSYYKENNRFPNYCTFNSADVQVNKTTSTNTKKNTNTSTSSSKNTTKKDNCTNPYVSEPHLLTTKEGLGQNYHWDCSANSVQQALKKLSGKTISEDVLIKIGGVTTKGVGHDGINTMIEWFNRKYGTKYKVTWKNFSDLGKTRDARFEALGKLICKPNVAVICHIGYQDSGSKVGGTTFGHYEVLDKVNTKTKYVRALNSLGNQINKNAFYGHLQDRSFEVQANYFAKTPGGQKAVCIISK